MARVLREENRCRHRKPNSAPPGPTDRQTCIESHPDKVSRPHTHSGVIRLIQLPIL